MPKEAEYLGHVITADGVRPNSRLVVAVKKFLTTMNVKEVRRFLGMALYYCKFIPKFAIVAGALHHLTRKDVKFLWPQACQAALDTLKKKISEAPVLSYPYFGKDFVLGTNASVQGLGAVLCQEQSDGKMHPVAFASKALSPSKKNYSRTDLEILAVVWAMSQFHSYLYSHRVTVYTDHSAVKAVLEVPNPSGLDVG